LWRGLRVTVRANDQFWPLSGAERYGLRGCQALINISVVLDLIP
jgi:hypothetical protein